MALPLSPGDRISDVYVVEEIIGEGGMAVVARAQHVQYRHRAAIKMMLPEAARNEEVRKRFEREQRTLLELHSDHTVRIHGAGVHRGLPYMVLELLEGTDLAELLKTRGPLETDVAVLYLLQTCHAVAEAHALGVVHRDLKPANLFLTRRDDGSPCMKVLDFGISKASDRGRASHEESLTQTKAVMGSPFYMAPEQLLSARDADTRSDIWALGVTLYELLSSSLPFAAQDTEGVCRRILHDNPTPLRKLRPMVPGSLEGAIMRCLRRRPQERYANVADFAQRLADFGPAHARQGLEAIYRHISPSHRAPQHSLPPETVPAPARATDKDDATLYLQKGGSGRSGLGWTAAVLAVSTFGLGAGLGWVLSLDVDPTNARRPSPQGEPPAPAPASLTDHDAPNAEGDDGAAAPRRQTDEEGATARTDPSSEEPPETIDLDAPSPAPPPAPRPVAPPRPPAPTAEIAPTPTPATTAEPAEPVPPPAPGSGLPSTSPPTASTPPSDKAAPELPGTVTFD